MKKMNFAWVLLAVFCLASQTGWSQEKKIVIIKKTVDENGKEVTEKIVREGEAAGDFEWTDEQGNLIKVERQGPQIKVIVEGDGSEDVKIIEGEGLENLQERLSEEIKELHLEHRDLGDGQYFFFKEGDDGPVFEWNGEGELPEKIRLKLKEKGLSWEGRPEGLTTREEKRPFLGVQVGMTEEVENINGVETRRSDADVPGLKVLGTMEGSAAEKAGLQAGDIITSIDWQPVNTPEELIDLIASKEPGQEITIDYRRDGKADYTRAILGEQTFGSPVQEIEIEEIREGDDTHQFFYFNGDDDEHADKKIEKRVIIIRKDGEKVEIIEDDVTEASPLAPAMELPERRLEPAAFDAFPNPTDGRLTVRFQAEPGPTVFTVTDVLGREIHRQELDDFDGRYDQQIDVRSAAKGTLLLTIRQGERVFTEKVLLK